MFYRWLSQWELKHRWPILGGLLLITLVAGWQIPKITFDFSPEAMLEFSDEETAFSEGFAERFNIPDNVLLVVLKGPEPNSVLTEKGLTLLHTMGEAALEAPLSNGIYSVNELPRRDAAGGVKAVMFGGRPAELITELPVTPVDVERVREQVHESIIVPGSLMSEDGSTVLLIVNLKPEYRDLEKLDGTLDALEETLRDQFAKAALGPGYELHIGGLPYIRMETVRFLKSEQLTFWPLVGLLYFVLMLLIFRRLSEAALPLITVGFATAWIVGLMAALGEHITIINNILPTLILVIGVTNAIHILMRVSDHQREQSSAPPDPVALEKPTSQASTREAVRQAIQDLGVPCLLTSLTSAIGFLSLVVAHSEVLRDFGWQVGLGIMMAYVGIIVVLPASRSFFTHPPASQASAQRFGAALESTLAAITRATLRHPWRVLLTALAGLGIALAMSSQVAIDAKVLDAFPEGSKIHATNQLIEERLGGILPLEIQLTGPTPGYFEEGEALERVERLQRYIRSLDDVLNVTSLVDLVAEVRGGTAARGDEPRAFTGAQIGGSLVLLRSYQAEALAQYAVEDMSQTRISIRVRDSGNQATLEMIEKIQAQADDILEGSPIEMRMTGTAYLSAMGLDTFVRDLFTSLATASVIIFLILTLFFRSLRVGFVSVLPNALPLAITVGLMPLMGYELNTTTVVVLPISLGLAVDNSIHFISRFRVELAIQPDLETAIHAAFSAAGKAIISSNLLLMTGFALLFLSDFEPTTRVAALTVTTIATALLAAILVLPSLLVIFYKRSASEKAES